VTGGKPWTDGENKLLLSMIAENCSFQNILESGKFPDRTADAIRGQLQRLGAPSSVNTKLSSVGEIVPADDNLSLDEVVKLFSSAYREMCASKEVDKYKLERFRLVFQAARDFGPLLAHYEKWDKIEKKIEELSAKMEQIQATKDTEET
jgi:hypothetical protein